MHYIISCTVIIAFLYSVFICVSIYCSYPFNAMILNIKLMVWHCDSRRRWLTFFEELKLRLKINMTGLVWNSYF